MSDEEMTSSMVGGHVVKPYICADSAFALSPSVLKCYEVANP